MGRESYDIELGAIPLMLATSREGKQAIEFGRIGREPGPQAEVGTIVMPSFHHGPGQEIANDPRAVKQATVDISVPGRVYPPGATSTVFTAAAADDFYWNQGGGAIIVPKQGNPTNAPKIYFVTAKRIYSVETDTDTPATVYTNPATLAFTGQAVRYRDKLFFPREDENRNAAAPIIVALPSETAYEATGIEMSRAFSAGNAIWYVVNHGHLTPPEIYWSDDDDFPGEPVCVTVKFTGNGTAQDITTLPWQPDVMILKGNYGGAASAVLKTDTMGASESKLWGTSGLITTGITGFLSNGFSVGAHDAANKDGVEYVATCFKKKAGLIDTLTHVGNAIDDRDIETSFSPDLAFVAKGSGGTGNAHVVTRPSTLTGDNSLLLSESTNPIADAIQALGTNNFQVGQDVRVNETGVTYHDIIFKESPGILELLTYEGNSQDDRDVSVALAAEYAIVACASDYKACQRMKVKTGDWSVAFWGQAFAADWIQALDADSIQVGTSATVNKSGYTYHCMAFGATTEFLKAGPFALDAGGYCTWLHVVGPFTLVFKADRMIYGTSQWGSAAPILVHDEGGGTDVCFGHGARMDWRGRLLIPTGDSLKALYFPSLEGEDINPIAQLPGSESAYRRLGATCSVGSRQLMALETTQGIGLLLAQRHPDGEFLAPVGALLYRPCYAVEAIRLSDGSYAAYILHSGQIMPAKARITKAYVASMEHAVGPTTEDKTATLSTSLYGGDGLAAAVTKSMLQLRGYAIKASEANPVVLKFSVDGWPKQDLGEIKAAGPFSLPFPGTTKALGRLLAIHTDPLGDGRLVLPLYADFDHCPKTDDIVTFGVDVRDATVNALGGIWRQRPAVAVVQKLSEMQGQIKPVKFGSARAPWTVRVISVSSANQLRRAVRQGEEDIVYITCRRLG